MNEGEETSELDAFLDAMGIDTKPDTPEEELVNLVFNDEARRGTLSYYLRNEMQLLMAYHKHIKQYCTRESLTEFLIGHYIDTYLANHMRALNPGDVVPDRAKVVTMFCEHEYTLQVSILGWEK